MHVLNGHTEDVTVRRLGGLFYVWYFVVMITLFSVLKWLGCWVCLRLMMQH